MCDIETCVFTPIVGESVDLNEVKDAMFREQMLGMTWAFKSWDHNIYAPFDGIVQALYPTNHAIGIKRCDGLEVLIHIGVNTAELNGNDFTSNVKQGDKVCCQDLLLSFNDMQIQNKGYDTTVFVVLMNVKNYRIEKLSIGNNIKEKDVLVYAEKV